jgi:putative oxidoreductase
LRVLLKAAVVWHRWLRAVKQISYTIPAIQHAVYNSTCADGSRDLVDSAHAGLLLIRLVTGGFFICHGGMMLFGWFGGSGFERTKQSFGRMGFKPVLPFASAAPATQLVCGALVASGLLWPVGPALLVGPMLVAIVGVHWPRIWVTEQGIEFPAIMGVVQAGLGLLPAGKLSLDRALGIDLPNGPVYALCVAGSVVGGLVAIVTSREAKKARAAAAAQKAAAEPTAAGR